MPNRCSTEPAAKVPVTTSAVRRTTLLVVSLLGAIAALAPDITGLAQNSSGPPDLATERAKYEEELAAALQPVQKRYTARLKVLQKHLARKGDKAGAMAVETELEKLGAAIAQQTRYPIEGKWVVKYHSGATRTYVIHADGSVEFVEENQAGRFTKNGEDVLIDFGDNKLERLYWSTVLVVEHYNPKATYRTAPPTLTGFAEKAP